MIARNFFLGVCGGISVLSPWVGEVIIFSLSLASPPPFFFASSFCCSLLSRLRLGEVFAFLLCFIYLFFLEEDPFRGKRNSSVIFFFF